MIRQLKLIQKIKVVFIYQGKMKIQIKNFKIYKKKAQIKILRK